jgi:hypothetical protein
MMWRPSPFHYLSHSGVFTRRAEVDIAGLSLNLQPLLKGLKV